MSKREPRQPALADFVYTDEMRERALRHIEEKRRYEDPDLIFQQYCEVTFRYFMSRISQHLARSECHHSEVATDAGPTGPKYQASVRR
jgi:hypothetical protein